MQMQSQNESKHVRNTRGTVYSCVLTFEEARHQFIHDVLQSFVRPRKTEDKLQSDH